MFTIFYFFKIEKYLVSDGTNFCFYFKIFFHSPDIWHFVFLNTRFDDATRLIVRKSKIHFF